MNFCSLLQENLAAHFPKWTWKVVENQNPSTSVIILSQGNMIPGEVIVSVTDAAGKALGAKVVGGQAYCDYIKSGRGESEFARELGGEMAASLKLT
jgi:hypothetical protein